MYTHEWMWYLDDKEEVNYYRARVREFKEFLREKKPNKINRFRKLEYIIKDIRIVAKNTANKRRITSTGNKEIQWLSANINAENEAECIKWMDDNAEQSLGFVCALASRGFSVSLKPARDDDYMATIYGELDRSDVVTTVGISAFALDPGDALLGVLCKFIFLLNWGKDAEIGMERPRSRFR